MEPTTTPARPPTRGELIQRAFLQGGALFILAAVVWVARGHLESLTKIIQACAGSLGR